MSDARSYVMKHKPITQLLTSLMTSHFQLQVIRFPKI